MYEVSTGAIQSSLTELYERQRSIEKSLEVEEIATSSDDILSSNRQYSYSQEELSKIEERRSFALKDLDVKLDTYKETRMSKISLIRDEMERYIEAYKAKKEAEIKKLEQEIDSKETAISDKKNILIQGYDSQVKFHQETCMKIAEKAGMPTAVGYRRKKAENDMIKKQIVELQAQLAIAQEREMKARKDEAHRRLAEEKRKEDAQKSLDLAKYLAAKASEREAEERKVVARNERKKKLRDALERCKTPDAVWDVENEQEYLDWEDEELIAHYKEKLKRNETTEQNEIVQTRNPDAPSVYIPSAPLVHTQEVPTLLGSATLLQSTKPKMMPKQLGKR